MRKRERKYSRDEGWKRGGKGKGNTAETRDGREKEEGEEAHHSRDEGWVEYF